jgi:hypothetical protein
MALELEVAMKANEELHQLREGAEGREANTEGKLRMEKQHREGDGPILDMSRVAGMLSQYRADVFLLFL